MKKLIIIAIVSLAFCFSNINIALSWDDGTTHRLLSEYATDNSVLNDIQNGYLIKLGFSNELTERLRIGNEENSILEWIAKGAELEDNFPRYLNHFHDPTAATTWEDAGLNDGPYSGMSSLLWAQNGAAQDGFLMGGDHSWQKVRQVYYWALTATTKELREVNFAQTFLGLGHQMHLLQDTAVPAHVRNDAHPIESALKKQQSGDYYFEAWARDRFRSLNQLKNDTPAPDYPNVSFDVSNGYAPITQFYDTNTYDKTNPSTALSQGLSEYTNANFFSTDTVFANELYAEGDNHYFPYPSRTSTNLQGYIDETAVFESVIAEDGTLDGNVYIRKTADGELIEHFVRTSKLTRPYLNSYGEGERFYKTFFRDDECHNDYAQKLIPRAVGYSAGLLDYFFRGDIEAVDAMPIISNNGDTSHVTLKVKNNTPNETLGPGAGEDAVLLVSYKYGLPGNEVYGVSNSVTFNEQIASGSESINVYTFSFPDAIPSDAEAVTLTLVYRGKLGNEENAVAAGAVKKGTYVVLETTSPWTYAVFKLSIINENGYSYKLTPVEANCTPANGETVCKTVDGGVNQNIYAVDDIGIENWDITSYSSINDFNETYDNNLACNDHPYGYTTNVNNIYDFEKSGIELEPFYSGEESIQNEIDKESFYTSFDDDSVIAIPYGIRVKRGETNSVGSFSIDQYGYPILSPYLVYQGKENEYGDFFSYYKWSHNKIKTFKDYHCPDPPNKAEISAMYNEIYNVVSVFIIFKVGDIRQRIQIGDMTSYEKCHWNGSICSRDIYTRDGIWETVSDFSFSDYNIVYAGNRYDINGENMDMSSVVFGLINTDRDSSMPLGYWQEWEINDANAEVFLGNWYGSFSYDGNFKRIGIYSVK